MAKSRNKKKSYSVYKPLLRVVSNALKKRGKHLRDKTERDVLQYCFRHHQKELFETFGIGYEFLDGKSPLSGYTDLLSMGIEYGWMQSERHSIFIDSDKTIESLRRGKYSIQDFTPSLAPYESFMVCLPSKTMFHDTEIEGVLVSYYEGIDISPVALDFISHVIGCDANKSIEMMRESPDFQSLKIQYTVKGECYPGIITLNPTNLRSFIDAKDGQDFINRIDGPIMDAKGNPDAVLVQYELLRVILPLMIYIKAKPDALQKGLPKGGIRFTGELDTSSTKETLSIGKEHQYRGRLGEHVRTWFIRQLVHERFYKGEYAHYKPGSRLIFVDETTVNMGKNIEHTKPLK